jgi:2',3'-cyclic-nucleotide 2'-phosphodiesterase (5'-nucleotidase family)
MLHLVTRGRGTALFLAAIVTTALLAIALGPDRAEAGCGERTENVTLNILATAENVGEIDECGCKVAKKGGLSRRFTFVDSVRTANAATLVLDAGDWADVSPKTGEVKSDFILGSMTTIGYDATMLGRRELELGVDHIRERAGSDLPLLASNLRLDGEPLADEVLVRDVGCVRVGVFGLMDDPVLAQARHDESLTAEDVHAAADEIVRKLEAEGAEVIVLLAQMQLATVDSLLQRRPEIDVAVLGYQGGLRRTHATIGDAIVVRPGRRGQYLGWLELEIDPTGEIVKFGGESLALGESIRKDPEIETEMKEIQVRVEQLENEAGAAATSHTHDGT